MTTTGGRVLRYVVFLAIFAGLGFGIWELGQRAARAYERMLAERVMNGLDVLGYSWAEVRADGLKLDLLGHAPDTFERELAYEAAKAAAPMAEITNYATATLAPPERRDPVRVEIHRDKRGITMTGQTASRTMRAELNQAILAAAPGIAIQDLTGIQAALPRRRMGAEIAVAALAATRLPNAFVLVQPGRVSVEGQAADAAEREALTRALSRAAGDAVALDLRLRIPAAVIAPFAFTAEREIGLGVLLERCAARDDAEQRTLLAALGASGVAAGPDDCPVGLGGPSGDWPGAVTAAFEALNALPAGRLDIEYRAVFLTGYTPTAPDALEAAAAALRAALPEGYELRARLEGDDVATRAAVSRDGFWLHLALDEGTLSLGGMMPSGTGADAVATYAKALFPDRAVKTALTAAPGPAPDRWQGAVMQILEHLTEADRAEVHLAGYSITLRAHSDAPWLARRVHDSLTAAFPDYATTTEITVDLPARLADLPLPGPRCAERLNRAYAGKPIDFDVGSARITKESAEVLDMLAAILGRCTARVIEVGGHTDARGSEQVNLRISQARADAVAAALADRGVPLAKLRPKGYGEAEPIANNATEEGRARNRRIEFRAIAEDAGGAAADGPPEDGARNADRERDRDG